MKQINRSRERSLCLSVVRVCLQQAAEKQTAETGDPVDGDSKKKKELAAESNTVANYSTM